MSLVSIAGGATGTGTFTVLAPSTNTNRTLTLPDSTTTVVGTDATQTLTNKTLTLPVITSIVNSGTLTLPTSTDTLVGRTTTDTLTNKTLTSPTLTTPNVNSAQVDTVSGTAPLYFARAWVNFNGTGTVAIRASGNVSSITDNGVGVYTVNFTTAMPSANYALISTGGDTTSSDSIVKISAKFSTPPTTSAARVVATNSANSIAFDTAFVMVTVFI